MKFYKLGLLTLLISLFILNSCKTQDGIGLDVDPATQINGTTYLQIPVS
jgi:predicted small secreted protein